MIVLGREELFSAGSLGIISTVQGILRRIWTNSEAACVPARSWVNTRAVRSGDTVFSILTIVFEHASLRFLFKFFNNPISLSNKSMQVDLSGIPNVLLNRILLLKDGWITHHDRLLLNVLPV